MQNRPRPNSSYNLFKRLFSSRKKENVRGKKETQLPPQESPMSTSKEELTLFPPHPKDSLWNVCLSTLICKPEYDETNHHHTLRKSKPS